MKSFTLAIVLLVVGCSYREPAKPEPINSSVTLYGQNGEKIRSWVSYGHVSCYQGGEWIFVERENLTTIRVTGTVVVEPAK